MSKIHILLDNGHGTPVLKGGKQSPDASLREPIYVREITKMIKDKLDKLGAKCTIIVPEITDIPLTERCKRVNQICKIDGSANCLLISVHINASGMGTKWEPAHGWECHIAPNASQKSKDFAELIGNSVKKIIHETELEYNPKRKIVSRNNNKPWVSDFQIIRRVNSPAVLTENLFMTNETETRWLLSDEGKNKIVDVHVDAIKNYVEKYK